MAHPLQLSCDIVFSKLMLRHQFLVEIELLDEEARHEADTSDGAEKAEDSSEAVDEGVQDQVCLCCARLRPYSVDVLFHWL